VFHNVFFNFDVVWCCLSYRNIIFVYLVFVGYKAGVYKSS